MLEYLRQFCTKRRMIISVILLGVLTILLLIFEEALTQEENKPTSSPGPVVKDQGIISNLADSENNIHVSPVGAREEGGGQSSSCWLHEGFTVERPCTACSVFEINSRSPPVCIETGLKEVVRCSISGLATRSCTKVPDVEKKRFLVFESLMLLVTILSYGFVKFRTSQLERIAMRQIEKNLAAGY